MTSRTELAERLLADVEAERALPPAERPTRASDAELSLMLSLLQAAAAAEAGAARAGLRGRISRQVADGWSLEVRLSGDLVSFDERFLTE